MTDCDACLSLIEAREERAGILEFDAGLPRQIAERRAREMNPDQRECNCDNKTTKSGE